MSHRATLGEGFPLDLQRLIGTRMLIQANSGGGKSWAIRRLLEATHGQVQQIVLDIEGDFPSLRSRYDYVLAGKGGDIPADPRAATLLAHKLLELQASSILDLEELKHHERIRFVRLFLEAMIAAPKSLWHPVLVVLDEAHLFAPEQGQAESFGAVVDLATRGRKRGFCCVLATQRISKLSKDAAAECNNKLIGRTGLDIDVKRAADELGLRGNTAALRDLEPGQFYGFGPAFPAAKGATLFRVGAVKTTHPTAGESGKWAAPAPSAKVKAALAKLVDLPKEAEQEQKDLAGLRAEIASLRGQLHAERSRVAKPLPHELQTAERMGEQRGAELVRVNAIAAVQKHLTAATAGITAAIKALQVKGVVLPAPARPPVRPPNAAPRPAPASLDGADAPIGKCERMILGFLSTFPGQDFSAVQVGAQSGYSPSGGGFLNALSKLRQLQMIERVGSGRWRIPAGAVIDPQHIGDTPHTLRDWIAKLGACERKIWAHVLDNPATAMTRVEVAEATGYAATGGGFLNALSALATLGLIVKDRESIRMNPDLNRSDL